MLLALLVAATCLGQTSPKEQDCTLGEVRPVLKDSRSFKVERVQKGPREIIERARLDPTTRVEVLQGGCAHYGVQVRFIRELRGNENGRNLVGEALELINALKPHTDPESLVFSAMSEMLAAHKDQPYARGDILQDAAHPDVTLDVSAETDKNTRVVLVTYSFVL